MIAGGAGLVATTMQSWAGGSGGGGGGAEGGGARGGGAGGGGAKGGGAMEERIVSRRVATAFSTDAMGLSRSAPGKGRSGLVPG